MVRLDSFDELSACIVVLSSERRTGESEEMLRKGKIWNG